MKIRCSHCHENVTLTPKFLVSMTCPVCHTRMDKDNGKAYSGSKFFIRTACLILFFLTITYREAISTALTIPTGVVWVIAAILFGILLGISELLLLKFATRLK